MATYTKGDKFITKFMVDGVRHSRMTDTRERGEAWELAARAALKLGKSIPEPDGVAKSIGGKDKHTLAGVLRSATKLHWDRLRASGRTAENAELFVEWAGPKSDPATVFTPNRIRDFIEYLTDERKVGNTTLNRYMTSVRGLMKHADVKMFKLPHFKGAKNRKRFFSPQEETAVVEYLTVRGKDRYRDLFMFLNDTGLRPWAECVPLKWRRTGTKAGWIDLAGRMVRDIPGKNGGVRDVPLTRRAMVILERCPHNQDGPWSDIKYPTANDIWGDVTTHFPSLADTVWYSTRHTFASRLIQNGKTVTQVARLLGNTAAIVDGTYSHLAPDHLKDAVDALEGFGDVGTKGSVVNLSEKRTTG